MLLVWVVGGLSFKGYSDMCDCPLPQRPLALSIGGGKPYPYVLTLKGKPLGRNPNKGKPYCMLAQYCTYIQLLG